MVKITKMSHKISYSEKISYRDTVLRDFLVYLYCMKAKILKNSHNLIDSSELTNYILAKGGSMNHLKLQKVLYYVEAWHLVFFNKSIVEDEFQAWVHGPVSKKLWNEVKNLSVLYSELEVSKPEKIIKDVEEKLNQDQIDLINDVIKKYGKQSGYNLECLTHNELPWIEAREGLSPNAPSNNIISKKTMKKYYSELLHRYTKK